MSKLIEDVAGSSGMSRTEHALRSVLSGDVVSSRLRLTRALDRLGYQVISEDPLYARRGARGWAVYYCSLDILNYPTKLRIALKELGPNATLATFDYEVEHFGSYSFAGDRQTLTLEAQAIVAVANQNETTLCTACGTNQPDDARFCRVCGAPNVGVEPVELELLRLTTGARGGHHLITAAVIWALSPILAGLIGILSFGAPGGRFAIGLLLAMLANFIVLLFVFNHSRKTLSPGSRPPPTSQTVASEATPDNLSAEAFAERRSITEGTTELLIEKVKQREREPVLRRGKDTSPIVK